MHACGYNQDAQSVSAITTVLETDAHQGAFAAYPICALTR